MAPKKGTVKRAVGDDSNKKNSHENENGVEKTRRRTQARNLMRWTADDDIQLLLQTYAICKKNNIQLPLEAIGAEIKTKKGLPIGGNAISQHLTKVCKRRIAANLPVPVSIEGRGSPGKKSKPPPKIANRSSQDDDDEEKEEVSIDIGAGSDESFSEAPFTRGKRTLRSKKQKITEAMTDDEDANHVIDDSNMGDVDTEDTAENFDPNAEYIGAGAGFLTYTKDESMEPVVEYKGSEKKATEQGEVSPKQSRIVTLRFSKGRLFSANPEKLAGSPSFVKLTNVASFESPPAIFSSQPASLSPLDQTASLDSYQQAESFPAYSHNFDDSGSAGSFTQPSVYGSGLTHQNQGPLNLYLMDGSYVHNPNHIAMQGFQNGLSPINHDLDDFFDFQDASNITTNSTNLSGSYGSGHSSNELPMTNPSSTAGLDNSFLPIMDKGLLAQDAMLDDEDIMMSVNDLDGTYDW